MEALLPPKESDEIKKNFICEKHCLISAGSVAAEQWLQVMCQLCQRLTISASVVFHGRHKLERCDACADNSSIVIHPSTRGYRPPCHEVHAALMAVKCDALTITDLSSGSLAPPHTILALPAKQHAQSPAVLQWSINWAFNSLKSEDYVVQVIRWLLLVRGLSSRPRGLNVQALKNFSQTLY